MKTTAVSADFMKVVQCPPVYQQCTLSVALRRTAEELVRNDDDLIERLVHTCNEKMADTLQENVVVNRDGVLRGEIASYRKIDEIWAFELTNCSFVFGKGDEDSLSVPSTGRLRVVAFETPFAPPEVKTKKRKVGPQKCAKVEPTPLPAGGLYAHVMNSTISALRDRLPVNFDTIWAHHVHEVSKEALERATEALEVAVVKTAPAASTENPYLPSDDDDDGAKQNDEYDAAEVLAKKEGETDVPTTERDFDDSSLNSEDDLSSSSSTSDTSSSTTSDYIVCMHEKVSHKKSDWRALLCNGIIQVRGRDYAFRNLKAQLTFK